MEMPSFWTSAAERLPYFPWSGALSLSLSRQIPPHGGPANTGRLKNRPMQYSQAEQPIGDLIRAPGSKPQTGQYAPLPGLAADFNSALINTIAVAPQTAAGAVIGGG
jgi:hypothetical protein